MQMLAEQGVMPDAGAETPAPPAIDPKAFRKTLGAFVTGVTIITTVDHEGIRRGVTVNSFSSVSLDPPLVLWSQAVNSASHPAFRDAPRFAVNILSEDQVHLSERFSRFKGDKFESVPVRLGAGGVPLIEGCSAHLECELVNTYEGGDHAIFIGRVDRLHSDSYKPLVFGGGSYLSAQPHEYGMTLSGTEEVEAQIHLKAVRVCTAILPDLARQLNTTVAVAVWGSHGPTIIRWEQPPVPVRSSLRTGIVCQLTSSATGCVYAAFLPVHTVERQLAEELAPRPGEPGDEAGRRRANFESLCAQTLRDGLCVLPSTSNRLNGDEAPMNAIAVPVFDARGRLAASLTAVGSVGQLGVGAADPAPALLKNAAATLSARLGFGA